MDKNKKNWAPLLVIFAAFLWSLDGLLRRSLYVLPPIIVVFYEHLIGFIILIPFLLKEIKEFKKMDKKSWGALFWISLLSSVLGTLFYTAALGKINFIQFSVVVLLQQMQPVFENLFGWFILKEKLTRGYLVWAALALVAAYMISFPDLTVNLTTGSGTLVAALLAVAAAFSWGSSTAFSRYALLKSSPIVTTGARFGLSVIIAFVMTFGFGVSQSLTALNTNQMLTLLVISLSTGMVALWIYYKGLQFTPVRVAAICELTWPLSAVFIGYFYLHQSLTLTQIIGSLVLLNSIYQVSLRKKLNVAIKD